MAGTYTGAQKVTLSTGNPGDTIYYTTDGSTPTGSSTLYTGAIAVGSTETVKAVTVKAGKTSSVYSAAYTISVLSFKPVAGVYTRAQSVALSTINAGDTIYYTTDGSTPTRSSSLYSAAIPMASNDTIKAISVNGAASSTVYKAFYQFIPWEAGITYGSVSDPAGNVYKTVAIGSQTWMAENLNYAGSGSTAIGTWRQGQFGFLRKYGRLYSWAQVMNGSASSASKIQQSAVHLPHRLACPHRQERTTLLKFVRPDRLLGGSATQGGDRGMESQQRPERKREGRIRLPRPARRRDTVEGAYNVAGSAGFWWSATASDSANAWTRSIDYNSASLFRYEYDKTFGYSLRCVKD